MQIRKAADGLLFFPLVGVPRDQMIWIIFSSLVDLLSGERSKIRQGKEYRQRAEHALKSSAQCGNTKCRREELVEGLSLFPLLRIPHINLLPTGRHFVKWSGWKSRRMVLGSRQWLLWKWMRRRQTHKEQGNHWPLPRACCSPCNYLLHPGHDTAGYPKAYLWQARRITRVRKPGKEYLT